MSTPGKSKKRVFRVAYGLLASPVNRDGETPYVDHRKTDFKGLAALLTDVFTLRQGHAIAVANDGVDQVTLAARSGGLPGHVDGRDVHCTDFGEAMLRAAQSSADVIDVRNAWHGLHYMSDRYSEAPPPMMICFVVTSADFHDAMQWLHNANVLLGRDLMSKFLEEDDMGDAMESGILPIALQHGLERIFGWPYDSTGVLMRIASDKPPSFVR